MHMLYLLTMYLLSTSGVADMDPSSACLADGEFCFSDGECCAEFCSHHWPPTTTPVFGECGLPASCQGEGVWCKEGWEDATCCQGLQCVLFDPDVEWGSCHMELEVVGEVDKVNLTNFRSDILS